MQPLVLVVILVVSIAGLLVLRFWTERFGRRTIWKALSKIFDECGIHESLRHRLMFASKDVYLAWNLAGEIPEQYHTVCAKYARLHHALRKKWGEAGNMSHWLLGANMHFDGKSPVSFIVDGGESKLNEVLEYLEHQH